MPGIEPHRIVSRFSAPDRDRGPMRRASVLAALLVSVTASAALADPIMGSYTQTSGVVDAEALFIGQLSPVEAAIVSGGGTRLNLSGDQSSGFFGRLGVGQTTTGSLTVSGGAIVDATPLATPDACPSTHCNASIGNGAGADGTLVVTGTGSRVDLINRLDVGSTTVLPGFGLPGGASRGEARIEAGGSLNANTVQVAVGPAQPPVDLQNGNESVSGSVLVDGPGSSLTLTTNPQSGMHARMLVGVGANSNGTVVVRNEGQLTIDGTSDMTAAGAFPGLSIAHGAGSQGLVRIEGDPIDQWNRSRLAVYGNTGYISVAASNGTENGIGRLEVTGFSSVYGTGLQALNVGGGASTGGQGSVLISDGGVISMIGTSGAGSVNPGAAPVVNIGRGTGTGSMTLQSGGSLQVVALSGASTAPRIEIGLDAGATGSLSVDGQGTGIRLGTLVQGGPNPFMSVGRRGTGSLSITNGGSVSFDHSGGALVRDSATVLNIGGGSGDAGGHGSALVSGTGSQILLNNGFSRYSVLTVGRGAGSVGSLMVQDGGKVSQVTVAVVGIDGGQGDITLDHGRLEMWGSQFVTGVAADTGPALVLGRNGGTGSLTMRNQAELTITAPMPNPGGLLPAAPDGLTAISVGGSSVAINGGTGAIDMRSGATLTMSGGTPGATTNSAQHSGIYVGRIGTGTMSVGGAGTSVDVSGLGNGGRVMVGVEPFGVNTGTGTLTVTDNAQVNAGRLLGIAHTGLTSSGGTGTLVVESGGTVRAESIYIGNRGFVTGNGGLLIGNVFNDGGVIGPGQSPGRLTIEGGYQASNGGKIVLEIEADGLGGFITDSILFLGIDSGDLDFSGTEFEFVFLGDTNPLDFVGSGLGSLSSFLKFDNGDGEKGIDEFAELSELLGDASFGARAERYLIDAFSYSAADGFTRISASQVPEPGTLALLAMSVLLLTLRGSGRLARARRPL